MAVAPADTISTGFGANAVLSLGTNNLIVSPLTRMTLDAFLEKEQTVTTNLFLRVGAVRARVDDSGAKKQAFTITSPYSTASVRGTDFSYDGVNLRVFNGSVGLLIGAPVRYRQDQLLTTEGGDDTGDDNGSDTGATGGDGEIEVGSGETLRLDVDFGAGGTITTRLVDPTSDFATDPTSSGAGRGDGDDTDGGGGSDATPGPAVRRNTTGAVDITWEWEETE